MRDPGIRDRRKWRPKEEMGGNGEQERERESEGERERERESEEERERERERVLKSVAFVCKMI